jgi:hypothetical protein
MKLVQQPEGSNLCGQAVVAMLLNLSLEEACELMGKRGKTTSKDLVQALCKGGVGVGQKRIPLRGNPPPLFSIVFARYSQGGNVGHWMLFWNGRLLDPSAHYETRDKIVTSYIPIQLAP